MEEKKPKAKKVDLKYSIMDKALGIKQALPKPKDIFKPKAVKSSPFIQSISKQIPKNKPKPKPELKLPQAASKTPIKTKKDSSSSFVLVGVISLIVVVALFFVLTQETDLIQVKNGKADEDKTSNGNGNKGNGAKPLTFEETYAFCVLESNIQKKDECLQELAVKFNKEQLCEELANLDKEKCRREVWKANAIVSQELDYCRELLTKADKIDCVEQIALNTADKTFCLKLLEVIEDIDKTEINSCLINLAVQEKDLSVCDEIEGSMKETCKFNAAIAVSDPDLCVVFNLPTIRNDCISRIAKNNNDVSLCERITNSLQKNKCINDLS